MPLYIHRCLAIHIVLPLQIIKKKKKQIKLKQEGKNHLKNTLFSEQCQLRIFYYTHNTHKLLQFTHSTHKLLQFTVKLMTLSHYFKVRNGDLKTRVPLQNDVPCVKCTLFFFKSFTLWLMITFNCMH